MPSTVSPPNCTASGSGLANATAGNQAFITVIVRDSFGNAVNDNSQNVVVFVGGSQVMAQNSQYAGSVNSTSLVTSLVCFLLFTISNSGNGTETYL